MTLLVFRVGLIVGVSGIIGSQVEKVMETGIMWWFVGMRGVYEVGPLLWYLVRVYWGFLTSNGECTHLVTAL